MTFSLFLSDSICCFISSRLFSEAGPFFRPFLLLPPPSLEPVLSRKIRQIKPPPISNLRELNVKLWRLKLRAPGPRHTLKCLRLIIKNINKINYTRISVTEYQQFNPCQISRARVGRISVSSDWVSLDSVCRDPPEAWFIIPFTALIDSVQ